MKLVIKILRQLLMKKKNYRELKKSIRIMNSQWNSIQRSDAEKVKLIGEEQKKVLMKLLSIMKLLITIWNKNMYKYVFNKH